MQLKSRKPAVSCDPLNAFTASVDMSVDVSLVTVGLVIYWWLYVAAGAWRVVPDWRQEYGSFSQQPRDVRSSRTVLQRPLWGTWQRYSTRTSSSFTWNCHQWTYWRLRISLLPTSLATVYCFQRDTRIQTTSNCTQDISKVGYELTNGDEMQSCAGFRHPGTYARKTLWVFMGKPT